VVPRRTDGLPAWFWVPVLSQITAAAQPFLLNLGSAMTMENQPVEWLGNGQLAAVCQSILQHDLEH
jgi:hypothetical protein